MPGTHNDTCSRGNIVCVSWQFDMLQQRPLFVLNCSHVENNMHEKACANFEHCADLYGP